MRFISDLTCVKIKSNIIEISERKMKKLLSFMLFTLILMVFVACDKTTTVSTNDSSGKITTTQKSTVTTTKSPTTTLVPTTATLIESTTTEITTIIQSGLKTEELPIHSVYYGNTNGNANNKGLVVYDKTNKLHYFSVGSNLYSFNPATEETEILFSLTSGGNIRNLSLSNNHLYFVSTNDMWAMKYDFATKEISTVYEGETYFINRYDIYVFMDIINQAYSTRGFALYYDDDQEFHTQYGYGATNVNISGTKLFFTTNDAGKIEVMSNNFSGKSTIVNFSDQGIEEIDEMLLLKDSYTGEREFAFIGLTATETNLYVYNTNSGLSTIRNISSGDIHSLNYDGSFLYYIVDNELQRYEFANHQFSYLEDFNADGKYVFVINHWIYFSNETMTALYRVDPDTFEANPVI
jgi:hypothetical protein